LISPIGIDDTTATPRQEKAAFKQESEIEESDFWGWVEEDPGAEDPGEKDRSFKPADSPHFQIDGGSRGSENKKESRVPNFWEFSKWGIGNTGSSLSPLRSVQSLPK
jgi:hypothetical protein